MWRPFWKWTTTWTSDSKCLMPRRKGLGECPPRNLRRITSCRRTDSPCVEGLIFSPTYIVLLSLPFTSVRGKMRRGYRTEQAMRSMIPHTKALWIEVHYAIEVCEEAKNESGEGNCRHNRVAISSYPWYWHQLTLEFGDWMDYRYLKGYYILSLQIMKCKWSLNVVTWHFRVQEQ